LGREGARQSKDSGEEVDEKNQRVFCQQAKRYDAETLKEKEKK